MGSRRRRLTKVFRTKDSKASGSDSDDSGSDNSGSDDEDSGSDSSRVDAKSSKAEESKVCVVPIEIYAASVCGAYPAAPSCYRSVCAPLLSHSPYL